MNHVLNYKKNHALSDVLIKLKESNIIIDGNEKWINSDGKNISFFSRVKFTDKEKNEIDNFISSYKYEPQKEKEVLITKINNSKSLDELCDVIKEIVNKIY
nr:MAG: hypothetical protein [Lokiarchaeota virus Ratatoskr Meg22_1012]